MSIAVSPGPAQRIAQTIDNLRITDEEFKIKVEECNGLRQQLTASLQTVERLQLLLRKQENISASKHEEFVKTKHALDIVLKELTTKQQSIDALQISHTTIQDVEINGLGSFAASDVAAALATSEHITSVSLPNLSVNDAAFQAIMKVVNNREQLFVASNNARLDDIAVAKEAKNDALVEHLTAAPAKHLLLKIDQLDLSQSSLVESKSFEMIRGQAMSSINLSGCSFVQDVHVGEILRGCPQLESIDLSNCPQLTNDSVSYINASKSIRKVNLLGSSGMGKLNFFFVETLVTNLAGVSQLDCPALKSLPVPITHL
ncbi:Hypothetical protein, putative, partial [Bodo saltans]